MRNEKYPPVMHPTHGESMLLTVHQEDPEDSNDDQERSDNVSEDELDMMLATMGTTPLKESDMVLLQDDAEDETDFQEEAEQSPQQQQVRQDSTDQGNKPTSARRVVKRFIDRITKGK